MLLKEETSEGEHLQASLTSCMPLLGIFHTCMFEC
jgi:hypothetical protein